jgi:WD40 repeat protein
VAQPECVAPDPIAGHHLSEDGQRLASGSLDGTAGLWEAGTGRQLATLRGHTGGVRAVALSGDGRLLASGGVDGTLKLWEADSGVAVRTLRPDRHYERMDITGLTGVTPTQRRTMIVLGAVDRVTSDAPLSKRGQAD